MSKILITGANGFIGKQVVSTLLSHKHDVHALCHNSKSSIVKENHDNLHTYNVDLLNASEIKHFFEEHKNEFPNLIHLAWYVGPKCHVANINLDWVTSSLTLLEEFHLHGGETFLGAGTCSEYEYKYGYLSEYLTPTDPGTLYGNGKNALYRLAKIYCKQNGLRFLWPRIFNLYGPNEKSVRLVPYVINCCLKNEDIKVSDCLKFQDYLHVSDTAKGIVSLFESNLEDACNICSGKPVQLRTIVETIAGLTNFKGNILFGSIPAAFGDDVVVGNNEKLKTTGWSQDYDLTTGLKQTINWWIEHNV